MNISPYPCSPVEPEPACDRCGAYTEGECECSSCDQPGCGLALPRVLMCGGGDEPLVCSVCQLEHAASNAVWTVATGYLAALRDWKPRGYSLPRVAKERVAVVLARWGERLRGAA